MAVPILSLIVAMADNRVIGHQNQLPWHLPDDLLFFKQMTMGKPVIMGRKTYESIGKPLPKRRNLVVTHQSELLQQQADVFSANTTQPLTKLEVYASLSRALASCQTEEEVMVIGGSSLFSQVLRKVQRMYVTQVHASVVGDVHFPVWQAEQWQSIWSLNHDADERHEHAFTFHILERK